MSRSYKKHPVCTDSNTQKRYWKRFANRHVRRRKDTLNHRLYRKAFCSWLINDYRFRTTLAKCRLVWEESHCIHRRYYRMWDLEEWKNGDSIDRFFENAEPCIHENPEPEPWEQELLDWRKCFQFK